MTFATKGTVDIALDRLPEWIDNHHRQAAAFAAGLTLLIAVVDWKVTTNISLGLLYAIPIFLLGAVLSRIGIVFMSVGCAFLRELFSPFRWQPDYSVRLGVTFVAFCCIGLLMVELSRNRRLTTERMRLEQESLKQLGVLVETSPLSIAITSGSGDVLLANESFSELLSLGGNAVGQNIFSWLPAMGSLIPKSAGHGTTFRLDTEAVGMRSTGEPFFAHVWLTTYTSRARLFSSDTSEARISWVVWDASDDVRGRDLAQTQSATVASRALLAAFSHELKNLSSAAVVLAERVSLRTAVAKDAEFHALAAAVQDCSQLAAQGLRFGLASPQGTLDLSASMDQARITLQSMAEEAGVGLVWNVPGGLPLVRCDHVSLVQVFLNLLANSTKAIANFAVRPEVTVDTAEEGDTVNVRFRDNGPGVADPQQLFIPFRSNSGGAGVGLHVSRAVLRAFGGDLSYEPRSEGGASFIIRLTRAPEVDDADTASADR